MRWPWRYSWRLKTNFELLGNVRQVVLLSRTLVGTEPLSTSDKLVREPLARFDWGIDRKSREEMACLAKVHPK